MCNGSLDEHLFKVEPLSLPLRHSVLTGVAAALSYLHEDCAQCVLHRDIKSSNVLLDGEFHAYLGDFGLARLVDHQKMEKTTMMAGTLGYMAPEIPHTGKATKETDVFSFGVLVLEVVCGERPLDMAAIEQGHGVLVDRVWRAHEAGDILQVVGLTVLDQTSLCLDGVMEENELVKRLLHLGLLCCNPNPEERPSTRLVSQLLQYSCDGDMEMAMPALPVCKPHARYSTPGFSPLANIISSSGFSVVNVEEAGHGSLGFTAAVSSVGAPAANVQTSFVASSAISSGRSMCNGIYTSFRWLIHLFSFCFIATVFSQHSSTVGAIHLHLGK